MDEHIFDKVQEVDLKKTMETSYVNYAMSVIVARALPDARDGLKPVQRRILYAMIELNNGPDKPHRKCARIVGDTMGKYHPHGDASIYAAMVRMAQNFSMRYMLVDGHGNFGSIDGYGAAASRYTEARMSKITAEMLAEESPYNTRLYAGLTPTPISNPGLASLQAALNPEQTNYYYYALDTATGEHRFFATANEHASFVATQNYE